MEARKRQISILQTYVKLVTDIFEEPRRPKSLLPSNCKSTLTLISEEPTSRRYLSKKQIAITQAAEQIERHWRSSATRATRRVGKYRIMVASKKKEKDSKEPQESSFSIIERRQKALLEGIKRRVTNFHKSDNFIRSQIQKMKEKEDDIVNKYIEQLSSGRIKPQFLVLS